MSIGTVLTLGIGNFTGGGVRFIPTLGYGTTGTPPIPPAPAEQPSNWQADYWKRKSKKEREEEEREERIRLGILPPEQKAEAIAAVIEADQASRQMTAGEIAPADALLAAMEARAAYENAYRQVYKEAYIAEVVAELWREDMKRITRRRKAIALLLH